MIHIKLQHIPDCRLQRLCVCSHTFATSAKPSSHTHLHASKDTYLLLMMYNYEAHLVVLAIGSAGIRSCHELANVIQDVITR